MSRALRLPILLCLLLFFVITSGVAAQQLVCKPPQTALDEIIIFCEFKTEESGKEEKETKLGTKMEQIQIKVAGVGSTKSIPKQFFDYWDRLLASQQKKGAPENTSQSVMGVISNFFDKLGDILDALD